MAGYGPSLPVVDWLVLLLQERLGHRFDLHAGDNYIECRVAGSSNKVCIAIDRRFYVEGRLDGGVLRWTPEVEGWKSPLGFSMIAPALSEERFPLVTRDDGSHTIHYDILGLAYWALSRQEEVGRAELDSHGRFPAVASHALQFGYLDRPVVDEWLELLGQVFERTWPGIGLASHSYSVRVTHDVDRPSRDGFFRPGQLPRKILADVVKRRDVSAAIRSVRTCLGNLDDIAPGDPYNTFDWLMTNSESAGLRSAFFFIAGRTNPARDARYDVHHLSIKGLLRRIHNRGHEIGLHPSYETYLRPDSIASEAENLRRVCAEVGIRTDEIGVRMHYLRWRVGVTWRGWKMAGLTYDSTLGYADFAGFRCGTCREYPGFDPVARQQMGVRIRPLIVMDQSIISAKYMGMTFDEATLYMSTLRDRCRLVNGCFNVLWHNSQLDTERKREAYRTVLS